MRPPPWDREITAETVSLSVAPWELKGLTLLVVVYKDRYSNLCSGRTLSGTEQRHQLIVQRGGGFEGAQ